jgi:hypothetical protein
VYALQTTKAGQDSGLQWAVVIFGRENSDQLAPGSMAAGHTVNQYASIFELLVQRFPLAWVADYTWFDCEPSQAKFNF